MEVKSVNEIIPHEKQYKISKNCERVQLRKKPLAKNFTENWPNWKMQSVCGLDHKSNY